MRRLLFLLFACVPCLAWAGQLADIEIYDRNEARVLPVHEYQGRLYVVGEARHEYELRIRNRSTRRLLAVTSVDGVNVVSGQTAAVDQRGYVIDPWSSVTVEGWRKSLDQVARFYFTRLPDSYAARTGRPDDVGVIGIALFAEAESRLACCDELNRERAEAPAAEPHAADKSAPRSESSLGTGHGTRESSPARYVDFERSSEHPQETLTLFYDSRRNLIAQGVLAYQRSPKQRPDPFPGDFVPDPEG
ncbi:MAG: hypothetical protein ACJ8MR_02635 [Povalibacter sp.]